MFPKAQLLSFIFAGIAAAQDSGSVVTSSGSSPSPSGSVSSSPCPDAINILQDNNTYCCPGPVRGEGSDAYCCVGAPIVDARPCFPFCSTSTSYSCQTTIPITASNYDYLVLTQFLHSTYGAGSTTSSGIATTSSAIVTTSSGAPATESSSGPTSSSDAPSQTTTDTPSQAGDDNEDSDAESSSSSTGAAPIITQAPMALGAAALMALAAL